MKMLQFLRTPLIALLLALPYLFCITQWAPGAYAAALPIISDEEYRAMSPADRKEFEKKLKEQIEQMSPAEQEAYKQQAVETLFESLTPEQQKEVLEEAARVERMSEEEQRAYYQQVERDLEKMFDKQEKPAPEKKPEPQPEPKPELKLAPKAKKKEVVFVKMSAQEKALKEAVNLINEIIQAMDDLSVKIEKKEDFLYKLGKWGKKKKINPWDGGFEWSKLKIKIDTLRKNLDKLKDRDEKTKMHKHLLSFVGNENLYATIYNLSVDLADHEPSVRSGEGGLLPKDVRRRSHKALRALIDTFVNLLYPKRSEDNLIASLEKLFAQYAPEVKKIVTEEKTAAQQALAKSKRPGEPSPVKIAGRGVGYERPRHGDFYDEPDAYDPGYAPSFSDYERRRVAEAERAPDKKGVTPPPAKKPKKPKEEEKKKEELQKDERLNKFLKRFDRHIEDILDKILDNPNLENLDAYLKTKVLDVNLAQTEIPKLNRLIRKATSGLKRIKSRIAGLPSESQKSYKEDIKGLVKSIKSYIEKLVRSIEKIGTARQALLSPDMRWAHFGEPKPQPAVLPPVRPQPVVLPPVRPQPVGLPPARPQPVRLPSYMQAVTNPTPLPVLKESAQEFLKEARYFAGW